MAHLSYHLSCLSRICSFLSSKECPLSLRCSCTTESCPEARPCCVTSGCGVVVWFHQYIDQSMQDYILSTKVLPTNKRCIVVSTMTSKLICMCNVRQLVGCPFKSKQQLTIVLLCKSLDSQGGRSYFLANSDL